MLQNVFWNGRGMFKDTLSINWGNKDEYENVDRAFQGELQQFTGLKDKNGKEIYEGDIVDWPNYEGKLLYLVEFSEGRFGLNLSNDGFGFTIKISEECEVIGNKFENPELLEEKK